MHSCLDANEQIHQQRFHVACKWGLSNLTTILLYYDKCTNPIYGPGTESRRGRRRHFPHTCMQSVGKTQRFLMWTDKMSKLRMCFEELIDDRPVQCVCSNKPKNFTTWWQNINNKNRNTQSKPTFDSKCTIPFDVITHCQKHFIKISS